MKKRKEYIGRVVSNKMDKSVVIAIDRIVKHPRYKKYIKRTSKLMAHDEKNCCSIGDKVKVVGASPLSARKHFVVLEVLNHLEEV